MQLNQVIKNYLKYVKIICNGCGPYAISTDIIIFEVVDITILDEWILDGWIGRWKRHRCLFAMMLFACPAKCFWCQHWRTYTGVHKNGGPTCVDVREPPVASESQAHYWRVTGHE